MANPSIVTLLASKRALDAAEAANAGVNGGTGANGAVATSVPSQSDKLTLMLTDLAIAMADAAGVVAYGSKKIFDFPEGLIAIDSVVVDVVLTKSSAGINADFDGDLSLGTVAASNNATLTSTEVDILASTATPQAVSGVSTVRANNVTPFTLDGSATAKDMYLNVLVDDADHDVTTTPCNIIVNGTVTVIFRRLGG